MTPRPAQPLLHRVAAKFEIDGECWRWTDRLDRNGYGRIHVQGAPMLAHRMMYEQSVGPIPDGLTLDHLCRNRACVNPDHLEPVSLRENILRGTAPPALHAVKTACPQGHAYDEANTGHRRDRFGRYCRACARDAMRQKRAAA